MFIRPMGSLRSKGDLSGKYRANNFECSACPSYVCVYVEKEIWIIIIFTPFFSYATDATEIHTQ